jgi:hypothetical protein
VQIPLKKLFMNYFLRFLVILSTGTISEKYHFYAISTGTKGEKLNFYSLNISPLLPVLSLQGNRRKKFNKSFFRVFVPVQIL